MTNLMCRGRKRGLAEVIATRRLAKLAKNAVAATSKPSQCRGVKQMKTGDVEMSGGMGANATELLRPLLGHDREDHPPAPGMKQRQPGVIAPSSP